MRGLTLEELAGQYLETLEILKTRIQKLNQLSKKARNNEKDAMEKRIAALREMCAGLRLIGDYLKHYNR